MMKVILSALWLLLCLNVRGQTISASKVNPGTITGIIVAGETGQPVEGVKIILKKSGDSTFSKSTGSDKLGVFRFDKLLSGTYSICVNHIGYRPFSIEALIINYTNSEIDLKQIK